MAALANVLPPEATVVRIAGFGLLRQGYPAAVEALAEVAGLETGRVREVLVAMAGRGAAELDDIGNLVGIGGLSLRPSRHELILDGVGLHTWCALDAVGIPAALRLDATARSRCGWCGALSQVAVHAGVPEESTVLIWYPHVAVGDVRRDFCSVANLFCGREHLDAWRHDAGDPAGEALTMIDAVERGRQIWALEAQAGAPE